MSDPDLPPPDTEDEPRASTGVSNRNVAFLLLGCALVFLIGAFAVGLLVSYGNY